MKQIALSILMIVALVGCGGDDNDPVQDCNDVCDTAAMCDSESVDDLATCKSECEQAAQEGRCGDAIADLASCYRGTTCTELNDLNSSECLSEIFVYIGECGGLDDTGVQ